MLSPAVHNGAVPSQPDGSICFDGGAGLTYTSTPVLQSNWTIAVALSIPPTSPDAYILAKSTSAGSRYNSLFVAVDEIRFYFRRTGDTTQYVLRWFAAVRDGAVHRLLVRAVGTQVELVVDGVSAGLAIMPGPLDDCGALTTDCLLVSGKRLPDRFFLAGCVTVLSIFPQTALAAFPGYDWSLPTASTLSTAATTTASTVVTSTTTTTTPGPVSCRLGLTLELTPCTCASTNCFSCDNTATASVCKICYNSWYLFDGACYNSCDSFRGFTTAVSTPFDNGFGRVCAPS
jgi:hypothetical protein